MVTLTVESLLAFAGLRLSRRHALDRPYPRLSWGKHKVAHLTYDDGSTQAAAAGMMNSCRLRFSPPPVPIRLLP